MTCCPNTTSVVVDVEVVVVVGAVDLRPLLALVREVVREVVEYVVKALPVVRAPEVVNLKHLTWLHCLKTVKPWAALTELSAFGLMHASSFQHLVIHMHCGQTLV